MRKIFVIAALASLVFASCTKSSTNDEQFTKADGVEFRFSPVSGAMLKGFIPTNAFKEEGEFRTMQVSGFRISAKDSAAFFIDKTFVNGRAASDPSAECWVATPRIYYPLGSGDKYTFLAYSDGGKTDASWDATGRKVELMVDTMSLKSDIVASAFKNEDKTTDDAMTVKFYHAQSYVTLSVKAADEASAASGLVLNGIYLKNVYNCGKLAIAYTDTCSSDQKPYMKWKFTSMCQCAAFSMPDGYFDASSGDFTANTTGYGSAITETAVKYEAFYPADQKPTAVVIDYTINGENMTATWDLTTYTAFPKWVAGTHYTYNITIGMYEVKIEPEIEGFDDVTVSPDVEIN